MIKFRISDFFSPRKLLYWRWLLWRSQYFSKEKLEKLQFKLLSRMLDHVFENVPYYQKLFKSMTLKPSDFKTLQDLTKIPILGKDCLIEHHDEFKARNFNSYHPKKITTSGTTGSPLTVYWDRDSNIIELTSIWRHFSWMGYRIGDPFLDIRSVVLDAKDGYLWNFKCRGLEISSDQIERTNIKKYAELLRKYRIKMWRGHPAAIETLCRALAEAGIEDVKPRSIFTASEAILDHQRKFIESWAGVRVSDNYGLKEHNALIIQCPHAGYHVSMEYGIVEIIKDDGSKAKPGEEGRIVGTGLHNRAFPLIRYDTSDYATLSKNTCPCGRQMVLMESLTGRIDDRVLTFDGRWVSGLHFAFFFPKGLVRAQLIQNAPGTLDIYVVPSKEYSVESANIIMDNLHKKLGQKMDIKIHQVAEVPYRSMGKFKFVINKMDIKAPK